MAKKANELAHTKWMCKYHIVFTPKYRRKVIYNQYKEDLRDIIKQLCNYKGVQILEGKLMPDHVHIVSTVGLNEETIKKYIQDQEKADIMLDKLSVKEYEDPFRG